jgi:hypothetical protein
MVGQAQDPPQQTPWPNQDVVGPVMVNAPAQAAPVQQPDLQRAVSGALTTVHGVVRNAATGEPLARAMVRIEGDAETGALTDNQGRFELPGVPAGPQIVKIRKPGFQDRPYATEDVGYQGDGPAHNVLVAAEMPDLDFALTPTSAIRGHVELSTGDPAQGIALMLLKQVVRSGRAVWAQNGTTVTNGYGAYRFANLAAGVYLLYTLPTLESEPAVTAVAAGARVTREGYPSIFYPETREFADATRIRLAAGQQTEANLSLTLEPFYTVTATALLPNGRPFDAKSSSGEHGGVIASSLFGPVMVLDPAGHQLAYTATFDFTSHLIQAILPAGSYMLLVHAGMNESSGTGQLNTGENAGQKQERLSGFVGFSFESQPLSNLRIPLTDTPNWAIHLRKVRTSATATEGNPIGVIVTATYAGEVPIAAFDPGATANEAGPDLLEMNGLAPGPLWINTQAFDRSLCVDSFTAGGINLAREPLNVALGASPPPMELTLRDDCAKLALSLPPMLSAFLPGDEPFYTVYVVPDFDTTADVPPMNMHPSSGATLTVDGLTPGSYHVYVFDRPVRLEYRNPEAIAALPTPGQAVTLTAGTTSNLVLEVPER